MAYTSIDNPSAYFKVQLYTGDGNSSNAITFNDTDTDMQPDLVWIKNRTATSSGSHILNDSVRGTQKALYPNGNDGEATTTDGLSAFGSDGFTVGDGAIINYNNDNYVAWCWKGGTTSGISTTGAEITPSAYSFNQTSGVSIVAYTGTGTDNDGVAHGLNAVPSFVISKKRSGTGAWVVKTCADKIFSSNDNHLRLDETAALSSAQSTGDNTTGTNGATATTFNVGSWSGVNEDDGTFIAYCFAEKQGFSKFGKYTGNGNADGPYIHLGFRPAWFLTKKSSASGNNWTLWDNKRDAKNPMDLLLHPNSSNAENDSGDNIDFCSNGVKLRNTAGGNNASGATYIFMAFAEAPFVNSNGVPCNAR